VSLEKALAILGDLLELKRVALRVEPQDPYLGQALKIAVENRVTGDSLRLTVHSPSNSQEGNPHHLR
jgi:hypothetical protein